MTDMSRAFARADIDALPRRGFLLPEWLAYTCDAECNSESTSGEMGLYGFRFSELECPVSTAPAEIARSLEGEGRIRVVFCTYHSLGRVTEAQALHGIPGVDLAIADEAHRTTGAVLDGRRPSGDRKVDFQEFHDDVRLRSRKRLYMTATPRLYTEWSKSKLAEQGIDVVDMDDYEVYGPELHWLPFAKAVEHRMLSDYRVIVLGVSEASVTPGLRRPVWRT